VFVYWSSQRYPSLRRFPPEQRSTIVQKALKKYARGSARRFFVALAMLLMAAAVGASRTARRMPLSDWRIWGALAAAAALFYGYLLWEINGPVRRAVDRYAAEEDDAPKRKR
jgi:hypothetical protein